MTTNARTMKTRTRGGSILAAAAAALLLLPAPAWAAGGGGGSGGSGGGGGGAAGGSGTTTGSLYSDLIIVLRDANGAPILKKYVVPATTETAATTEYCVQPVSYEAVPGLTSSANPVDGRDVWVIPLQGEWIGSTDPLPVAEIEACDPWPQYAMFVSEVELERLNLARTADEVIAGKIADVELKLRFAEAIALESTGRISYDGSTIDASPENAAMYQSLMNTGTIPGLPKDPVDMAGPPATIGPAGDAVSNSQFDAWELAAMTIGAAASKSTPLTLDAVEYYNRIVGFPPPADPTATPPVPEYVSPWDGVSFVRSANPDNPTAQMTTGERFVDYSGFSYNRSQTFKGSVTWLDVPTLTWKVSKITDVVPFTNLSSFATIGTNTLTGVTAFAQLADDVRALCNFIPDNTFLPGFYMDVPGVDTNAAQLKAIHDPAVDLGTLPENVFQTYPFQMTASLLNPWGGTLIDTAQLRLKIDASTALESGDVTATAVADGQAVPFTVDGSGDLVGKWGPDTGFPVAKGYNVSTMFDVTVAAGAPVGAYSITLELIDVDDPAVVLAQETGTINVNANVATVLWGTPLPKLVTQGVVMQIPLRVYSPTTGTGQLALTVTGPEALAAGDVKIYGSNVIEGVTDMVPMPLTLGAGTLVGTWNAALEAGYTPVTWYITVAEGAPVGNYTFGVSLAGGNSLAAPIFVSVSAPESHGKQPPDAGEDTTAPVVTVTPVGTLGSTASFTLTANEDGVTFDCMLTTNNVAGSWESCASPKTYTGLAVGTYIFSARGTDKATNVSGVVTRSWSVTSAVPDPVDPVTPVTPVGGTTDGSQPAGVTRTGGVDRIATAIALSQERFDDSTADAAVIARSDDFADALAAVPLTEAENASLLLTGQVLDARVLTEVDRAVSDTGTVYVVGGTGALPLSVDAAIKTTGRTVVRISGADRYDTAALVARKLGNPTAILLASGRDFPDALAGGTAAAKAGGVLLLTNGSTMPDASAKYLAEHATAPVYALGGPAAGAAPSATALVGTDRYDTAVKVAKAFFTTPTGVSVASGVVFADALSGGADAAAQGWPLLITRPAAFPQVAAQYVTATPTIVHADVYGGTGAVQADVATALAGCLHG